MFELHPLLAQDCFYVATLPLSRLLMMNDANYPWFILVPERQGIEEVYQLEKGEQQQLMHESSALSQAMQQLFHAKKMNVAALGNVVPQLHVHHVARFDHDKAWPAPVWGKAPANPYDVSFSRDRMAAVVAALREQGLVKRAFDSV